MKSNALLLLLLSVSNGATAVKFISGPDGWASAIGFNASEQHWDDIPGPEQNIRVAAAAPKRQELKSRAVGIPGAKSVKIRYGPYTVPAPAVAGGEGMVWNSPSPSIDKPCSKCMIVGMNAGLEFADGSDANTDSKMWLHHMVLFNIGTNAWDATCTVFGLPHMIVGSLPASSERIFSSGNERTMILFNPPDKSPKVGYPVFAADRFGLIADLMNMNPTSKQVWMTMYYDYVEDHPSGFDEMKPVWFDVAQCGISEVGGGTAGSNFKISSSPWTANFDGEIMGVGGHIHDGGVNLEVVSQGQVVCNSSAWYGTNEEAKKRADIIRTGGIPSPNLGPSIQMGSGSGGHDHAGGQHIIAMSVCGEMAPHNGSPASPLKSSKVTKGTSWTIKAYYDYKKFAGMKSNSGGMDTVMGISIMFVRASKKMRLGDGAGGAGGAVAPRPKSAGAAPPKRAGSKF
jgi:hypothetical protein